MTSRSLFLSLILLMGCAGHRKVPTDAVVELRMTKTTMIGNLKMTNHGVASGFFVSADGLIMTAKHCVDGFDAVEVVLRDGQIYNAEILKTGKVDDVALIRIAKRGTSYLRLATHDVELGDEVAMLGSPLGMTGTYVRGCVAGVGGGETLVDITTLPGYSGCPVLNSRNEVVGVCSKMLIFRQGAAHIGIMVSLDVLRDLIAGQTVETGRY